MPLSSVRVSDPQAVGQKGRRQRWGGCPGVPLPAISPLSASPPAPASPSPLYPPPTLSTPSPAKCCDVPDSDKLSSDGSSSRSPTSGTCSRGGGRRVSGHGVPPHTGHVAGGGNGEGRGGWGGSSPCRGAPVGVPRCRCGVGGRVGGLWRRGGPAGDHTAPACAPAGSRRARPSRPPWGRGCLRAGWRGHPPTPPHPPLTCRAAAA